MKTFKREMGRPPADWMIVLANLKIAEDKQMTKEELAEFFNTTFHAIKNFCKRSQVQGEYRRDGNSIRTYYSLKNFKKAAVEYLQTT